MNPAKERRAAALPPPPPPGRKGWPWTVDPRPLPDAMPDGSPWPGISLVTPSYNQGRFLEETIRSVLLQGYPNLEYIVIDGGSGDGSVDIIQKYEPWITYWESEKDRGQSHALNKGFGRAEGPVLGWLNSDDYLLPGALEEIASMYRSDSDAVAWTGAIIQVNRESRNIRKRPARAGTRKEIADWGNRGTIHQPACFFGRRAFERAGGKIREDLHYTMDRDLWMRLADLGRFASTEKSLATTRLYREAKSEGSRAAPAMTIEWLSLLLEMGDMAIVRSQLDLYAHRHSANLPVPEFMRLNFVWFAMRLRDIVLRLLGKGYY